MTSKYVLTFGRYKGLTLDKVPRAYLLWIDHECVFEEPVRAVRKYLKDFPEDDDHEEWDWDDRSEDWEDMYSITDYGDR